MQDYFRHATRVGELTRIFLTALEESHLKTEPMLMGLLRRRRKTRPPARKCTCNAVLATRSARVRRMASARC